MTWVRAIPLTIVIPKGSTNPMNSPIQRFGVSTEEVGWGMIPDFYHFFVKDFT
jgi:hypothetical protein